MSLSICVEPRAPGVAAHLGPEAPLQNREAPESGPVLPCQSSECVQLAKQASGALGGLRQADCEV